MSTPSDHRVRSWQRLRAAQDPRAKDLDARAIGAPELLAGARAGKLRPYSLGAAAPRTRSRAGRELLAWVAAAHKMGRSGILAGRDALADLLACSPSSAARAAAELDSAGWIRRRARFAKFLEGGRWRYRERSSALEAGPALIEALRASRAPSRAPGAPEAPSGLASGSSPPIPYCPPAAPTDPASGPRELSQAELSEAIGGVLARLRARSA